MLHTLTAIDNTDGRRMRRLTLRADRRKLADDCERLSLQDDGPLNADGRLAIILRRYYDS